LRTFAAVTFTGARCARVAIRAVLLAALCLLAACSDHGRSAESEALVPREPGNLHGTEWVLVATGDSDAVPADLRSTLDIEDATASGRAPCNSYNLAFKVDGTDLVTGEIASTRKACPERVMRAENRYFRALAKADTVKKEDDRLVLSGPDDTRLVYARPDDVDDLLEQS
jgi:heat shock protein HslJ